MMQNTKGYGGFYRPRKAADVQPRGIHPVLLHSSSKATSYVQILSVADPGISSIGGIFFLMNTKNKVERKYN